MTQNYLLTPKNWYDEILQTNSSCINSGVNSPDMLLGLWLKLSFLLDQKRNKKIFRGCYCFFCIHESSISSLRSLVGQIGFRILKEAALATLKQLFFLRILQTFDTRLRKLRTFESRKDSNLLAEQRKNKQEQRIK